MSVRIVKRNGESVEFLKEKVDRVVSLALGETNETIEWSQYEKLLDDVCAEVTDGMSVEDVSNLIEKMMMKYGLYETSKRFILYRHEHAEARNKGWDMTDLQYDIWSQKYELDNEGFEGFLDRVSGGNQELRKLIRDKKFLFGGRILAGRGLNEKGIKTTYSNCYVLSPPEDNLESIFNTARDMARVFSYGGGVGISLEKLRPRGAKVHNSAKATTGACSFADLYSMTTGLIGQSNRRGALMLSIPCSHPDLEEFITMKSDLTKVTKANISVMLYDDFMDAVVSKSMYQLKFIVEDTGEVIEKLVDADKIFTLLAKLNWSTAEPGALYWDTIRNNHLMSEDITFVYAGVNP